MRDHTAPRRTALLFLLVAALAVAAIVGGCSNAADPSSTVIGGTSTTSGAGPIMANPIDAMPYLISAAKGKLNTTNLAVPVGGGVVFMNGEDDSPIRHQFVAADGSFDTGPLDAGVRYLVYFDKETTVQFADKLAPSLTGTILVSASVSTTQVIEPGTAYSPLPGPWVGIRQGGPTTMNVHIKAGQAVNFYNDEADGGKAHQIVANDGSFDSGVLKPGQSFTFAFKNAGSFAYHDTQDDAVKGTITVN